MSMSEIGRKIPAVTAGVAIVLGAGALELNGISFADGTQSRAASQSPIPFKARDCKRFKIDNLPPRSNPRKATPLPNPSGKHPSSIRNMGSRVPRGTTEPHVNTVDFWHRNNASYTSDYFIYDYNTYDHRYADKTGVHVEVTQAFGSVDNVAGYICKNVVSTK